MEEAMALFQNPMNQCCDSPTGACRSSIWHLFPATTNIIVTAGRYDSSKMPFTPQSESVAESFPPGDLLKAGAFHVMYRLAYYCEMCYFQKPKCYASFIVVGNEWCSNFGIYFDTASDDWISKNFIEFQISSIHRVYLPLSVDHVFTEDFSMLATSCSFYQ